MADIWPRLKRKLACDVRRKKKKSSKKANACASTGLERFTALLKAVQSKKASSLVERTGASVSAARSLSRSAQEWTASTLARTASRRSGCDSREGSKSPEIVVSHCAVRLSDAQTRSSEYRESFSLAEAGFSPKCVEVEKSQIEAENVEKSEPRVVGSLNKDFGNLSEERQAQGESSTGEGVSPVATLTVALALPVKTGRCMKKIRRLQQTSNSAFVVLVALGAFMSSRFGRVGNSLAAVLTYNAVVRTWRRGQLHVRFMFSSVALYFLTPLRSYLTFCPQRLCLLPPRVKVIADTKFLLSSNEVSRNLEIEVAHEGRGSNLEISVLPLESAPSAASKEGGAPLSLLLTIPESSAASAEAPAASGIEPIPAAVFFKESGASSPSRRLAKKISSRFKKSKLFRSSSSSSVSLLSGSESSLSSPSLSGTRFAGSSEPGSPVSQSSHSPAASSPDRHRKCPFSRRLHRSKSEIPSEFAEVHRDEASVHGSEKKLSGKKSRLCRMSSTETLDIGVIAPTATDATPTSRPPAAEEPTEASRNVSWPMVGLLVTLMFLLVGRVPAIMATSLFLVVVSNAHPTSRRRDTRASEAVRKLHRSPPRRHPGSPPRRH